MCPRVGVPCTRAGGICVVLGQWIIIRYQQPHPPALHPHPRPNRRQYLTKLVWIVSVLLTPPAHPAFPRTSPVHALECRLLESMVASRVARAVDYRSELATSEQ
jgi:hypothetical protein